MDVWMGDMSEERLEIAEKIKKVVILPCLHQKTNFSLYSNCSLTVYSK